MAKVFILSGHFSHPAELDPWTDHRHNFSPEENFQDRWKKLLKECYGANSASRVLTAEGRISKIVNNFRYLSFSFAPRLLEELKVNSPNVYRRIQEADQESLGVYGHGNALAQPYNRTILPLVSERDCRLQLRWGAEAFAYHFGRAPEGFYLPEYAVNLGVLDELVAMGVKFVLLSPWQAEGTMPLGRGSWTSLEGAPAPSGRCFQIDRPRGSLTAFFHHPTLSRGMGKEHYLKNSDKLFDVILNLIRQEGDILTVSTEGELFGIQEPFADMCLAALWDKFGPEIRLGNYGLACEIHPPTELVKLKKGENEAGTSASCVHGVSRWKTDCGCREEGESAGQTWRAGLWTAFENLKDAADHLVDETAVKQGIVPEDFRLGAVNLWTGGETPRVWLEKLRPGTSANETAKTELLETALVLRHSQAMMEAGLWHHGDPTKLEARGGFLQALRVLELASAHTPDDWQFSFIQDLEPVILPSGASAADYFRQEILPRRREIHFPAALFLLDKLLRPQTHYTEEIGPYMLVDLTKSYSQIKEQLFQFQGEVCLFDRLLDREHRLSYLMVEDLQEGVSLFLSPVREPFPPQAFDLTKLPMGERQEIVQLMGGDLENQLAGQMNSLMGLLRKSMVYSRLLAIPPLPMTRALMELAATRRILDIPVGQEGELQETRLDEVESELRFAQDYGLVLDRTRLDAYFASWVARLVRDHDQFSQENVVHFLDRLLHIIFRWGFQPDLTVAQALVYEALQGPAQSFLAELEKGNLDALQRLRGLIKLGSLFLIETVELKDRILEFH